jgi:hypothetical protein
MHIFENGPHGVGLALGDPTLSAWPQLLAAWLTRFAESIRTHTFRSPILLAAC